MVLGQRPLQHRAHPRGRRRGARGHHHDHSVAVPHSCATRRGRRHGGRSGGHGDPARGRDPAVGTTGDARGQRSRALAPGVPGHGHPVVDGRHRAQQRALRRGRRRDSSAQAALVPARRFARSPHHRPQLAHRHRRPARRQVRRNQRRQGAVLRLTSQPVRDGRPQARPPARHDRRVGRDQRSRPRGRSCRSATNQPGSTTIRCSGWTCAAARSTRSSGRPASVPTTRGSTSTSSTARATSVTTAAWSPRRRACT